MMLLDLDMLLKSREALFKVMTHEIRMPLQGIIGLATSILQRGQLAASDSQSLEVMKSSGLRMLNLITDIIEAIAHKRESLCVIPRMVRFSAYCRTVI